MKERPILFSASMVRALLAGTKTQTRRAAKVESTLGIDSILALRRAGGHAATYLLPDQAAEAAACCPYGQPGDRLWVRESWAPNSGSAGGFLYRADHGSASSYHRIDLKTGVWTHATSRWHPSIHMSRAASRLTLEITSVRVERLQDISEADAIAEGLISVLGPCKQRMWETGGSTSGQFSDPRTAYQVLWEQINGPGSCAANPWVWVVEFKRVQQASSGRPSQLEDVPCNE